MLPFVLAAVLCISSSDDLPAAGSADDHLVPVVEYLGNARLYRELWQQKLLVTPGDVARYVQLPGSKGAEVAVSVYQQKRKTPGLTGGYWVTVTEPSAPLLDYIPSANVKTPRNPKTVNIHRDDAPLPESTAITIGKLWLAMLRQTKSEPSNAIAVDSTTELFSAKDDDGKLLQAQVSAAPKEHALALVRLGNSLANYPVRPASERLAFARKIEQTASKLLKEVDP